MRAKFQYWLSAYKSFSQSKAEKTVETLDELSDEILSKKIVDLAFFQCKAFIQFAKARRVAFQSMELDVKEKKALELYGDFLQMLECTNFRFPEIEESPLLDYCRKIKMSYSYKPVLILALIANKAGEKSVSMDSVIASFCDYYKRRIQNGLVAEKGNSIFASEIKSISKASTTIISNPVAVLTKDNVIVYDSNHRTITFTSRYAPSARSIAGIVSLCEEKLSTYYENLVVEQLPQVNNADIVKAISELMALLEADKPGGRRDESITHLKAIHALWNAEAVEDTLASAPRVQAPEEVTVKQLSAEDPRSVGKLVKEEMIKLSEEGFCFTEKDLANFCDKAWTKEHLHLYYAFFKKYDPTRDINEQRKDHLGNGRYWSYIFSFGGVDFLITSEWYKKDKPYFIRWFNDYFSEDRAISVATASKRDILTERKLFVGKP